MANKMIALALFCSFLGMMEIAPTGAQQYFIITPNVIRVDVDETILINIVGTPNGVEIPVTMYFLMTGSNERLSEKQISVRDSLHKATMRIGREQLPQQEIKGNKFITLVAQANTPQIQFENRQSILLSYQAGFVFIQTDKPLYTPAQRVDIRVVALNQDMVPAGSELQVDIISPDKIVVHRYNKVPNKGFLSLQFDFPPHPMFGNWTVNAYYGHLFKANTSVQFEVKEYVLPKFYVEVQTQQQYILPETTILITHVTARYVFGEPVVGTFHIKYGVFTDDGNLTFLQEKQGQLNEKGQGFEDLGIATMGTSVESLVGKRLIIQAFVTDTATGETINTNNTMVTFTLTPYKFNWDSTPRFFKRGLPFAVKANVQYMNGLPAANVPVVVSATALLLDGTEANLQGARGPAGQEEVSRISAQDGEVYFRLDVLATATKITVHLETADIDLDEANTESTLIVMPEESPSGEHLLLRLPSLQSRQIQQIGRNSPIEVELTHHENAGTLNYFVIAGGKIVYKGTKQIMNANTALEIRVTHEMVPSSRVVAYYVNGDGDVIADSLFIEVEQSCENPIHLTFEGLDRTQDTFMTDGSDKNIVLRIRANEYTTIGLLAIDEAIFTLRKYHRLTQKKVFKRMAGYDLGCGPGGGQTSSTIFKDAGVTVMTNANLDVPQREDLGCPETERRSRRSLDEGYFEILNAYQGEEREFCEMGLKDVTDPDAFPCSRRANLLAKRKNLNMRSSKMEAFYDCCKEKEGLNRGRGGFAAAFVSNVDLENTVVRSNFPESWMFVEVDTGENEFVKHYVTLPDSVTTWVIEAVGVSEDYDMCVADPVKLQVQPPFFLDVGLPYSVQRMEQIEIVVTVFNYADIVLLVTVYLKGVEGLCSVAQPGSFSEGITIEVLPKKPASVKFVIIPLEAKRIPIEVYAITNSSGQYRDAIRKYLTVRPEGYKQRDTVTIILDPENTRGSPQRTEAGGQNQSYLHTQFWGAEGENNQVDIIRYTLNGDVIPGTYNVHISLMGNILGNVIETVIQGLDNLLQIPKGCGEETMIYLAPNVYVYRYLKRTDQFTAALETSAEQFVGNGVALELTHRRPDGSFSVWGDNLQYPSSTWLTAFVSKVFCQAAEFAYVDPFITCKAIDWLMDTSQNEDGSFREVYRVHHAEMTGGVHGSASFTAYVLISLLECDCASDEKIASVAAATSFLEIQLPGLSRPYAIAITAYALALANSIRQDEAKAKLKELAIYEEATNIRYWGSDTSSFGADPKPYWYINRPIAIEVETTSYALLALLELDDMPFTHAIVNWLTDQENYEGGFVSTQDTVIALQALSEYAIKTQRNSIDISCQVSCQESDFENTFLLNPNNAIVRQHASIDIPETIQEFQVFFDSEGTGIGQLKFESSYNIPEPDSDMCDFQLIINGLEGRSGDLDDEQVPPVGRSRIGGTGGSSSEYHFEYDIKVKYLKGESTGMAILDVGLYTGYEPIIQQLDQVKADSQGNIQRYEVTDRSVVFYLNEIRRDRVERIIFSARRAFHVGKAQPVAVRVYDYYNPTVECVRFIHPQLGSSQLNTLCEGDTCVCAAGKCAKNPYTQLSHFDVTNLKLKACASAAHFAYEVEVISIKHRGNFQYLTMIILAPLKHGLDLVTKGENRTIWKNKSCGIPEIRKKNYLVIGSGGLQTTNAMGQPSFKYIIDERTSFYEWPTGSKLNSKKWQRIESKLNKLKTDLVSGSGCP